MVYNQNFIYYIVSFLTTIIVGFRLHTYLKEFFSSNYSLLVTLAVILHPLSIDAFLAPNLISGSLAFLFFIESLFFLRNNRMLLAIFMLMLATMCNFSYFLFPLYYFWIARNEFKKYNFVVFSYFILILIYFWKHAFTTFHNPFVFFSYFSLNLIVPLTLSIFNYSLFPFSAVTFILSLVFLLLFYRQQKFNSSSKRFWPMLFLPLAGVLSHNWIEAYRFWHEIVLSPSDYLCITFAFVAMLAIHLPKKAFITYFAFIFLISCFWGFQWFPFKNVLEQSLATLPENFTQPLLAKRLYGWQLLYEKNTTDGYRYLKDLSQEFPKDEALIKDLTLIKN